MLCILSTRYAAEFTTQRRTPFQPPGVEKPSSYYISVCVCVWCATPYWEYLNSNPAVIYWITYQIWVNSDTHAMIQARRARVAVLEIPLWCFLCKYQQILLSDTSVRTQTDTHTHSAVFSGWRSCPILNILLVSAAKCNLLHWSTHACTYTRS